MCASAPDVVVCDELSQITSLLWSFVPFHVVRVAAQSGLFELLAHEPTVTIDTVAGRMGWAPRPTRLFVDVLAALGLATSNHDGVALTDRGRQWFAKEGTLYVGQYFERLSLLEAAYRSLERQLETDCPYPPLEATTQRAFGLIRGGTVDDVHAFFDVLDATSTPIATSFLSVAELPSDAAVLDVGGGMGVFTRLLLERGHKGPIAFLDTPLVCMVARHALGKHAERIHWITSNWHDWQPVRRYDVIILSHVLHEERQDAARRLLLKCAGALAPSGLVYVIGLFAHDDNMNALERLFSLNIMLEVGGDNIEVGWLRAVAKEASLKEHAVHRLPGGRTLWAARRT